MISSLTLLKQRDEAQLTRFEISKIPVLNVIALMNLFSNQGYNVSVNSSEGGVYIEVLRD